MRPIDADVAHRMLFDGYEIDDVPTIKIQPVKQCRNITEQNPVDEFICSNCGLILRDLQRVEIDADTGDESYYEFEVAYCPKCGCEIMLDD